MLHHLQSHLVREFLAGVAATKRPLFIAEFTE